MAKLNSIFGNLLFISDDAAQYNKEQLGVLLEAFDKKQYTVSRAEFIEKNIMDIDYTVNGEAAHLKFNIATGERLD